MGLGYLFGQLFFGMFGVLDTAIGVSALCVAAISGSFCEKGKFQNLVNIILCAAILGSLLYVAIEYYTTEQIAGNYFINTLSFVFGVSVLILLVKSIMSYREKSKVC